jgi:hypothetical protein
MRGSNFLQRNLTFDLIWLVAVSGFDGLNWMPILALS